MNHAYGTSRSQPFSILLNSITEEEQWVAAQQKRAPRSRAELTGFIDTTILKEAQALNAER